MPMPVFEEYEPAGDCVCVGCVQRRRALARGRAIPLRDGGHPAVRGARRALVLATAAGVVLSGGGATALATARPVPGPGPVKPTPPGHAKPGGTVHTKPDGPGHGKPDRPGHAKPVGSGAGTADGPGSPQGGRAPLHGPKGSPAKPPGLPGAPTAVRRIDRTTIINRAKVWVEEQVPYSMSDYWSDGYRQDCSGFVSMAWNLGSNEWTGSLDKFAKKITKEQLLPGDMLLFHNPSDPNNGSHVTLFGGWVDETRTHYIAYEQTRPTTRTLATPYGYWNNATKYLPYRFTGVTGGLLPDGPGTDPKPTAPSTFPGAGMFGPGANNEYVARLGRMLIDRGGRRFYPKGPSTKWSESDRLATRAFQTAQGWTGAEADGIPGAHTWRLLVEKQGNDIVPLPDAAPGPGGHPAYPGPAAFRPGQSGPGVAALGRRLVEKGFGKHYTSGPGPVWSEADRRNVEAFQRAQGWRGALANGYPGPETWRRLFA
ncbi:peptidoglycan-binding protein [Streptomyces sp. NPDC046557]|uniref:peptidoglycan-binding protein n=1 Tax=Streptomyces sp. NPDC046557 TaxID=3155372 RepID=UPI0033CE535A